MAPAETVDLIDPIHGNSRTPDDASTMESNGNRGGTMTETDRLQVSFEDVTVVIGLEVHVQLKTRTKLFCGCSTEFGGASNTQTCPVCLGMPGSLPVLNEQAIRLAVRAGLALNCEIARYTKWDRKNYFYPDLPKGYQTSQLDLPICGAGFLDIVESKSDTKSDSQTDSKSDSRERRIRLERAHLEEDAGKSSHDESQQGKKSRIDLNRAGTPLLEVVTKPDLRSAAEAKEFLQELRLILTYTDVSDCNMQEGSLRSDANVNLHIPINGTVVATPIAEIKNLNSFRNVERAIEYEARRQFSRWQETGEGLGEAPKQTRGWSDATQTTTLQREKEESADYRYFPCPDLIAYRTTEKEIDLIRAEVGLLPAELRTQLLVDHQLKPYEANVIASQGKEFAAYFFELAKHAGNSKLAANWIGQEVLRYLNEHNLEIEIYPLSAERLGELISMISRGELDQSKAKEVLAEMIESGLSTTEAIQKLGIVSVDSSEIRKLAEQLVAQNSEMVQQIRDGNLKAIGALVGKAKKINPNANPGAVKDEIMKLI